MPCARPPLPWPALAQLGLLHPAHSCISSIHPPLNSVPSPVSRLRKILHPFQTHCHASKCQVPPHPLLSPLPSPAQRQGLPEALSPLSLRGDVTAPSKRELPPVSIATFPCQDALSRVESETSLCPLKGAKGSALMCCLPHLSFWTLYVQDSLPRNLFSTLCLSNSSTNFKTLTRHHLLQEAFSAFQTESGASSGCPQLPQLPPSAHSRY